MPRPKKPSPPAKPATARALCVLAINNHGGYGRWAFVEITDPWDAKNTIRAMLGSNVGALFQTGEEAYRDGQDGGTG